MAVWTGLGMNYGHHLTSGTYVGATATAELDDIRSYARRVRVAKPGYTVAAATITMCQDVCIRAKALGLITGWGLTAGVTLTSSDWAAYSTAVQAQAAWWAANMGATDEFSVGNELELAVDGTTLTVAQVIVNIKALAVTVKASYPSMIVTYQSPATQRATWQTAGLGSIDKIGFNTYYGYEPTTGGFSGSITNQVSGFGAAAYVSEWSTANGYPDSAAEAEWDRNLGTRLAILKASGIAAGYAFAYRDGSFGVTANTFALRKTDGTYRAAWWRVVGVRPPLTGRTALTRAAKTDRPVLARALF